MQRWIVYAGFGLFGLVLLAAGGYWGLKEYRLGKSAPRWVPLPLNYDVPLQQQELFAKQIEEKLRNDELLLRIVVAAKLKDGFEVADESAALVELKKRMFVKVGTADLPIGKVPAILIGLEGTRRQKEMLDSASKQLMREVWIMMGIDPDTGKTLQGSMPSLPADKF